MWRPLFCMLLESSCPIRDSSCHIYLTAPVTDTWQPLSQILNSSCHKYLTAPVTNTWQPLSQVRINWRQLQRNPDPFILKKIQKSLNCFRNPSSSNLTQTVFKIFSKKFRPELCPVTCSLFIQWLQKWTRNWGHSILCLISSRLCPSGSVMQDNA